MNFQVWFGDALTKIKDLYLEHPNKVMFAAGFLTALVLAFIL